MTLAQYLQQPLPDIDALRNEWLVFPSEFGPLLAAAHIDGNPHHVSPLTLTDGRLALCADLLTEISGGIFAEHFANLDPALFGVVSVVERAEIDGLFPQSEESII